MIKKLSIMLMIILLISSLCISSFASELDDQKKEIEDKINQTKNELSDIEDDKNEASTELEKLMTQVESLQNEISSLNYEISELQSSIDTKIQEIEAKQKEIAEKEALLKQRVIALYEAGETSFLDVIFNSNNIIDFLQNYNTVQTIVECDTKLIGEITESKNVIEKDKADLEQSKSKIESAKKEQEAKQGQLRVAQASKQTEVNKLSGDEKAKQSQIEELNKKQREVDNAMAEALRKAMEEEEKNNANNGGNSGGSQGGNGSSFDGTFSWPLDWSPRVVTSKMKVRWGKWHKGIDIGTDGVVGKRVVAAASGTVIYSTYQAGSSNAAGYGNYLIIYHGNGYATLYAHMNSKLVSEGQKVTKGQQIGVSGNTGGVAPHLHFEIRKASSIGNFFGEDNWKNPLDYLPGGYVIRE